MGPQAISGVATSITAFVGFTRRGAADRPVRCDSWAEFERRCGGRWEASELPYAVSHFFENGGRTAIISRVTGVDGYRSAFERLTLGERIDLLVVPPPAEGQDTSRAVWLAAERWARDHRAMLLVDPPSTWTNVGDAAAMVGLDGLASANTACYFPRLLAAEGSRRGGTRPFAPSGAVAGVIARTDATRGIWRAPAGLEATIGGVAGFEHGLVDADVEVINQHGVNALRSFATVGPVVWGARTGASRGGQASEWKYVNVRRLAHFVEESLERGLAWAVFEPNAEPLWSAIRSSVTSFLHDLFRSGAFVGVKPEEAYLVRCDPTTTTRADIDAGIVNVLVGIAPIRPAEFVVLRIRQAAGPPPETGIT